MFLIYPIILGIIVGYLTGGRITSLLERTLHWKLLALGALAIQLVIFSNLPVQDYLPGLALEALHYLSYISLLVFIIRNIKLPGILPIGSGIFLNTLAIFLNGGYMPTFPENMKYTALAQYAAVIEQGGTSNNSSGITSDTVLPWLGDIFYLPSWIPLSNVFSIGDLLIGAGVFIYLLINMKSPKNLKKGRLQNEQG